MLTRILRGKLTAFASFTLLGFCVGQSYAAAATVEIRPGADVAALVTSSAAGTTFVFSAGTYRLQNPIDAKNGDVFVGPCTKPPCAASSQAILNGSTLLTTFQRSGSYYYVTDQMQQGQVTIPGTKCQTGYPGCNYPEDLFFDDVPLIHVTSLSDVGPGSWFFDYSSHTIYFYDNPAGHKVETSVAEAAFCPGPANNVTVRGLTVEKFATPIMTGAVAGAYTGTGTTTAGANWIVEANEILLNHADGVRINYGWQVLNNYIHDNGNLGVGGGLTSTLPSDVVIQGNEISHNNYAHLNSNFGAGGIKVTITRGIVIRDNYVHDNIGNGIHMDTDHYNALLDHNTVADNTTGGIGFEISYSGTVRNNSLLRNGYIYPNGTNWLYGAQMISSVSQNIEAYCNTAELSAQGGTGMNIIVQPRQAGENQLSINNYFHHNTLIFDGNSGYQGGAFAPISEEPLFVNNRFDYNDYHFPNLSRKAILWHAYINGRWWGTSNTFPEFQADHQEAHGKADTLYTSSVPNIVISSPADQSTVSGIVDIKGDASASGSVNRVEFYVDWNLQSTTSSEAFSFAWNTSNFKAGQHTITAMAYKPDGVRSCYAVTLNVK